MLRVKTQFLWIDLCSAQQVEALTSDMKTHSFCLGLKQEPNNIYHGTTKVNFLLQYPAWLPGSVSHHWRLLSHQSSVSHRISLQISVTLRDSGRMRHCDIVTMSHSVTWQGFRAWSRDRDVSRVWLTLGQLTGNVSLFHFNKSKAIDEATVTLSKSMLYLSSGLVRQTFKEFKTLVEPAISVVNKSN